MTIFRRGLVSTAIIAFSSAWGRTPNVDGWGELNAAPLSPGVSRHDDVFFVDPSNGWLANIRMELYRTQDGGGSWEMLPHFTDVNPRTIGFASTTKGWLGNINILHERPDAALYETEDGGRTWTNISTRIQGEKVPGLCGMRVMDNLVVAVGRWSGPAMFVKSSDGGATWISRNLAP